MLKLKVNAIEQLIKAIQMILDATHYYRQLIKVITFKNNNYMLKLKVKFVQSEHNITFAMPETSILCLILM